jgi:hypothetical protein
MRTEKSGPKQNCKFFAIKRSRHDL